MKRLIIYTDGACSNNQEFDKSIGGWAFILKYQDKIKKKSGRVEKTTNNRMEILAVIEALKSIKKYDVETIIHSDSSYVINTITKNWKRNKNNDLWDELDLLLKKFSNLKFVKVKGHADDELNNLVDEMAVIETKQEI